MATKFAVQITPTFKVEQVSKDFEILWLHFDGILQGSYPLTPKDCQILVEQVSTWLYLNEQRKAGLTDVPHNDIDR